MGKQSYPTFFGIGLCFTLVSILFAFHSCKQKQTLEDRPNLPGHLQVIIPQLGLLMGQKSFSIQIETETGKYTP